MTTATPRRSEWVAGAVVAALVLAFAVGHYLVPLPPQACLWWANGFWTLSALLAGIECLRAARARHGPLRRAWALFGLGCLAWFAGMLVWDYLELVRGVVTPFPALSDLGYLLLVPLFAAGLLAYGGPDPRARLRLLDLSQLGVFLACLALVHVVLLHERASAAAQAPLYVATALAYPVAYMALLMQALARLWTEPPGASRRVLAFLTAGVGLHAGADSLYAYALLGNQYATGHYLDVAWVGSFALIWYAAHRARSDAAAATALHERLPRSLRIARLLTPAALVVTAATVIAFRDGLRAELANELLALTLLLFLVLGVREWASGAAQDELHRTIHASEALFRRVFHASPAIIAVSRLADERLVDVNEAFEAATGWPRAETVGRTPAELGLWLDGNGHTDLVARLRRDGTLHGIDWRFRTRAGELRTGLGGAGLVPLAGGEHLLVVLQDVTDAHRAQAERNRLSRAIEQTADAVMITDRDGGIEYVNPAFEAMTGYTPAEVRGRRPSLLKSGLQGAEFYRGLWQALARGESFSEVFVNRRRDGRLFVSAP